MTTSANTRRIENDEQYFKSLEWLINTAHDLNDPLLDDETKAKKQAQYDFVAAGIQRYNRGQLAQKYPGIRQVYQELGWEYDDPIEQQSESVKQPDPEPESEPVTQQPEDREEQETSADDPYDWLDDD